MNGCSILICGNDDSWKIEAQLRALTAVMCQVTGNYEVLLLGASSIDADSETASRLKATCPGLRLLEPLPPSTDAANLLQSGLATSKNEAVLHLQAGDRYVCDHIPALLTRLSRADFVQGKRRRYGVSKLANRLCRIPRWLLLGLDIHDPNCQFWAARIESLSEIRWRPEFIRYLGSLVAAEGFRVDELDLPEIGGQYASTMSNNRPQNLLLAWQERRRMLRRHKSRLAGQKQTVPFRAESASQLSANAELSNTSPYFRKSA